MALQWNSCHYSYGDNGWSQEDECGETGFSTDPPCEASFHGSERTCTGHSCFDEYISFSMAAYTNSNSCQEDSIAGCFQPATDRVLKRSSSASSTSGVGGGQCGANDINAFDPPAFAEETSPLFREYETKDEEPKIRDDSKAPPLRVPRSSDHTEQSSLLFQDVGIRPSSHVLLFYGCLVFYLVLYLALEADIVVAHQQS